MGFFDFFTGDPPPLIKEALRELSAMLDNGRDMFAAASAHLLNNEILDVDLSSLDAVIDERERTLRRAVLEHLNIDPRRELVFCVKLLTAVREAERIGDLCRLLGTAAELAEHPRVGPYAEALRNVQTDMYGMFDKARQSFADSDEALASDVIATHQRLQDSLVQTTHRIAHSAETPNDAAVYTLGAYALQRISKHLANIARCVSAPFDRIRTTAS